MEAANHQKLRVLIQRRRVRPRTQPYRLLSVPLSGSEKYHKADRTWAPWRAACEVFKLLCVVLSAKSRKAIVRAFITAINHQQGSR